MKKIESYRTNGASAMINFHGMDIEVAFDVEFTLKVYPADKVDPEDFELIDYDVIDWEFGGLVDCSEEVDRRISNLLKDEFYGNRIDYIDGADLLLD